MPKPRMLKHQRRAVKALCKYAWMLVEYGTGTGKTRVIVEACKILVEVGDVPIYIGVPNSLIEQTIEQFQQWVGKKWTRNNVRVLDSGKTIWRRRDELKRGNSNVYLVSHEAMSYKEIREGIAYRQWKAAFIDEASRFRNYSKRTQTLKILGSRSQSRYAFTGNLMVRTPADVFYIMTWLDPTIFGTLDKKEFVTEYCMLGGYFGNEPVDIRPDKLTKLAAIMDANRIQCELRDIRELPEREMIMHMVNMRDDQLHAYQQMRDELKVEIERIGEPEFISNVRTYATRLMRLQEIAAGFARNIDGEVTFLPSPKTTELIEILLESPDIPTVVWYWWTPERDRICAELKKRKIPFSLFGVAGAREQFLSGKTNVFVAQLAKGGFGLNLTRAVRMIYHSLPWDLDVMLQSQERNMRLDTTAEYLEIVHILTRNSVDGYVRKRLLDKAGISSKLSRSEALAMLRGT